MAAEMRNLHAQQIKISTKRQEHLPAEVAAISERISRLHKRLADGDPDLEADEIQIAINRAEEKRQQLLQEQPYARQSAKVIATLPKAAKEYRRQIELGLDQDPRAAEKARAILRKLIGIIELRPGPGKSLWAEYQICPAALLKAGTAGAGTTGSGGSQPTLSSVGYRPGYSLERATLKGGQCAAVRALITFGAGCCIASQRS
jgi:hypothetical protein